MCNMIMCCTVIKYSHLTDSHCSAVCSNVASLSLNSTLIYSILQLILCMLIWLQWAEMCSEFKCAQIIQISLRIKFDTRLNGIAGDLLFCTSMRKTLNYFLYEQIVSCFSFTVKTCIYCVLVTDRC